MPLTPDSPKSPILYCRCAFAQVVPEETKKGVLQGLCAAGVPFTAVPDLCEMAARQDERLQELAGQPDLRIAACHRRAVQWLFHGAGAALAESVQVVNMRDVSAEAALADLLKVNN